LSKGGHCFVKNRGQPVNPHRWLPGLRLNVWKSQHIVTSGCFIPRQVDFRPMATLTFARSNGSFQPVEGWLGLLASES